MSTIKGIELQQLIRQPYELKSIHELRAWNLGPDAPPFVEPGMGGPDGPGGPGGPGGERKPSLPAVYVENGAVVDEKSNSAVMYGGTVTGSKAENLRIVSYNGLDGGVFAQGPGTNYTVENSTISLSGEGGGPGGCNAGAGVDKGASLTLKNVQIITSGGHAATSCGGASTLRVYDSLLMSQGIPYGPDAPPSDSEPRNPPAPLEIAGNTRCHCTVENSYSYFYNSTIITDGWAALSTDMAKGFVYLEANDCRVVSTKSGYGAYADYGCHDMFRRCQIDVACMALICAGQADGTFIDCDCNCGTYFAMVHCVMGLPVEVGEVTVRGGKIRTKKDVVIVKSQNSIIDFDSVDVASECGSLVHVVVNDDPEATKVRGLTVYGVHVKLKDMTVSGDIVHEDPERETRVYLTGTALTGALKDVALIMDTGSKWTATADSDIRLGCNVETAQIDALPGVTITAAGAEPAEYELASGGKLIVK